MSTGRRIDGVLFIREWEDPYEGMVTFWCVGCDSGHTIEVGKDQSWSWDGNAKEPTFSPSVLSYPHQQSFSPPGSKHREPRLMPRCHMFVTAGKLVYLSDCEHELAGQTVDMVPLPERYQKFLSAD